MFHRVNLRRSATLVVAAALASMVLVGASGTAAAQPVGAPTVPIPAPADPVQIPDPVAPSVAVTPAPDGATELPPPEQLDVKMEITETDRDVRANGAARAAPTCLNDRWNSCYNGEAAVEITDPSGQIFYGAWTFDIQYNMRADVNRTNVNITFWYGNMGNTGLATEPGRLSFLLSAAGKDGLRSKSIQEIVAPLSPFAEGTFQRTVTPDFATTSNQGNYFTLAYYGVAGGKASDLGLNGDSSRVVRCDNQTLVNNGSGCVISSYTPSINWNESNAPAVYNNISTAIAAGKPSQLNRTSSAQATTNRGQACSAARISALLGARPTGAECDEYPFASSVQGGATSQIKWVPGAENGFQSRWISSFYQSHRVMQGDSYKVVLL